MLDRIVIDNAEVHTDGLTTRLGPVWLSLFMPDRAVTETCQRLDRGPVVLWLRLEMSAEEPEPVLVAFPDAASRDLYLVLRQISGIGRRSALATLGSGDLLDLLRAVAQRETGFFCQSPGIGRGRAELIIARLAERFAGALPRPLEVSVQEWVTARDGLVSSGWSHDQAEQALGEVAEGARDAEQLLERVSARR